MNNVVIMGFMVLTGFSISFGANLLTKTAQLETTRLELGACGARLSNLLEDVRSDNEIDQLTDDDLRNVPDHWLLMAPAD